MNLAQAVRFLGFLVPVAIAGTVLYATRDLLFFILAAVLGLLLSIPFERAYQRLATPEDIRRDLEDRVRNPPS